MRFPRSIIATAGLLLSLAVFLSPQEKKPSTTWDGSFSVPAHRIPLKDQFDENIIPTEPYPLPYSTRYTCAPCHDYNVIQSGLHFNAASNVDPGRAGEPWFWVDPLTGTVLPLNYRNWEGRFYPEKIGLTKWDFTLLFGRHMTGGGVSEPEWEDVDPSSRWEVSGKLEINCLGCHNASREQSHSEWAKQVLRENFRWAGVASSGFGEVYGMASRLPPTWTIIDGPNPDDTEYAVVPSVKYDPGDFDGKHNVFFDLLRRPDDGRCLTCHSVSPVSLLSRYSYELDVHSAAGIKCADCHRNDIRHEMIRGYEAETQESGDPERYIFSCRGCHIGKKLSGKAAEKTGRMGAPYPLHKGIPAVHFEKLNCTVCHSGPLPAKEPVRVRTSRANRLGIYGIAQWSTDFPQIVEAVYARDKWGKLAPYRLMWPSYWGKSDNGDTLPFKPSEVIDVGENILNAETETARILTALLAAPDLAGEPVLIIGSHYYKVNLDAGLDVFPYEGESYSEEFWWGLETEKGIEPLIALFDPGAEEQNVEMEVLIENVLFALSQMENRPGESEIHFGGYIFSIREGYLEKREDPNKNTPPYLKFYWRSGEEIQPLIPGFHIRAIAATVGKEQTLTEEQVALVLRELIGSDTDQNKGEQGKYFYVCGGRMFFLENEELVSEEDPAAAPILWPLGHQVRPARQSLGINGCKDCHTENSSFFFASVRGMGPLVTDQVEERPGVAFMGLDAPYQRLFGLSFRVRPILKLLLFVSVIVVCIILLIAVSLKIGQAAGLIDKRR